MLADAGEILALQRLAYVSEAEIYGDYRIPPLTQTLAEIESEFASQLFLKLVTDGKIVGTVRARERDGTCHIGRLAVHPAYQGRGFGTRLLAGIEACFPGCGRYELFTGHKSENNIRLYQKLGYQIFKSEKVSADLSLIFLAKIK